MLDRRVPRLNAAPCALRCRCSTTPAAERPASTVTYGESDGRCRILVLPIALSAAGGQRTHAANCVGCVGTRRTAGDLLGASDRPRGLCSDRLLRWPSLSKCASVTKRKAPCKPSTSRLARRALSSPGRRALFFVPRSHLAPSHLAPSHPRTLAPSQVISLGSMLKRFAIFVHRWLGVALCLVFLLWFPSGIGMMYWDYPGVSAADRLERVAGARSRRRSGSRRRRRTRSSIGRAAAGPGPAQHVRRPPRLSLPRRPRRARSSTPTPARSRSTSRWRWCARIAAAWTRQPASAATRRPRSTEVDQWTRAERLAQPAAAVEVLVAERRAGLRLAGNRRGRAVHDDRRRGSAPMSAPIPHWFYFTPLRKHGRAVEPRRHLVVGHRHLRGDPRRRRRRLDVFAVEALSLRRRADQHSVSRTEALAHGVRADLRRRRPPPGRSAACCRWIRSRCRAGGGDGGRARQSPDAFRRRCAARAGLGGVRGESTRARRWRSSASLQVKELELTSFAGEPSTWRRSAAATRASSRSTGEPHARVRSPADHRRRHEGGGAGRAVGDSRARAVRRVLSRSPPRAAAAGDRSRSSTTAEQTRYYIDPEDRRAWSAATARSDWVNRWVYHGLHSLDFPWLYNYRPLWDIVVITFMLGGTALCVTSLVLAWRVLGRKLARGARPGERRPDRAKRRGGSSDPP